MRVINATTHGYLDYLVVVIFLSAPLTWHFTFVPSLLCYGLTGVHLLMSLLTDFPLGVRGIIPLKWHGIVELVVGPVLIVAPFILGFGSEPPAERFIVAMGVIIAATWILTDYQAPKKV